MFRDHRFESFETLTLGGVSHEESFEGDAASLQFSKRLDNNQRSFGRPHVGQEQHTRHRAWDGSGAGGECVSPINDPIREEVASFSRDELRNILIEALRHMDYRGSRERPLVEPTLPPSACRVFDATTVQVKDDWDAQRLEDGDEGDVAIVGHPHGHKSEVRRARAPPDAFRHQREGYRPRQEKLLDIEAAYVSNGRRETERHDVDIEGRVNRRRPHNRLVHHRHAMHRRRQLHDQKEPAPRDALGPERPVTGQDGRPLERDRTRGPRDVQRWVRSWCALGLQRSIEEGPEPYLPRQEVPDDVRMILYAPAIPIDEGSDGRRIIKAARSECPLREEIVDHLAQILAHPCAQGNAEGALRSLDDAAGQPA